MKLSTVFLSGLLLVTQFVSSEASNGVYYNELKAFKKAEATKMMFDEDSHPGLAGIQRDIVNYKEVPFFQRVVRTLFLSSDVVVVTPETLPTLYTYVEGICKKANIAMPTIFVTRHKTFFNAFAQKLLTSTGAICIGQKLMRDSSDDALEAVVAHEIGHIKHNHVNKRIAISWATLFVVYNAYQYLFPTRFKLPVNDKMTPEQILVTNALLRQLKNKEIRFIAGLITNIIINKRFEKEADKFAYADNGKGAGIIEFSEQMLKIEQTREDDFVAIKALLEQNYLELSFCDYYKILVRFYLAKFGHLLGKLDKFIYHNTPLGAHPSPEARIAAAKEHLAQQENMQHA